MIARASTIFRGRPSRFPFALALRSPARTRSAMKLRTTDSRGPKTVVSLPAAASNISTVNPMTYDHCGDHHFEPPPVFNELATAFLAA
jgi:hypothetical protein